MTLFGKPHAISMDLYSYMDEDSFQRWYDSSLISVYYQFAGSYDQSYARKQVETIDMSAVTPRVAGPVVCQIVRQDPSQPKDGCSVCAQ